MLDLSSLRACLFDMDGVVIDSEPVSARVMQEAARRFDIEVPDTAIPSFKGLPGDVVYGRIAREFGAGRVDGDTLRAVRDDLYEARLDRIPLMSGLREVLDRMIDRGWRLALVTSSRRRHAERVVAAHDLAVAFTVVLGSEDVDYPKPAPDPYLQAASRIGVPPAFCLAVEDSLNGIRSAASAGCPVVGFGTEFPAEQLVEAGADVLAGDHEALARLLRS